MAKTCDGKVVKTGRCFTTTTTVVRPAFRHPLRPKSGLIPCHSRPTLMKSYREIALLIAAALAAVLPLKAVDLDDLLEDKGSAPTLAESEKFQENWNRLLDELAKREYETSDAALKLLEAERGFITPQRRDFIRLAGRVVRFKESLESDKEAFRDEFKKAGEAVTEVQREMKTVELEAAAVIKQHGTRIPPLVRQNMDKRYISLKAMLAERIKAHGAMKEEAKDFESTRVTKLENEIAGWIGAADTEESVVTGLVLSTAYLDRVEDSETIRELSQKLSGKQLELKKAAAIVAAVAAEIEPLIAAGKGDEAQAQLEISIAKVETSNQSEFLRKVAVSKLKALALGAASAKVKEERNQSATQMEVAEVSLRLEELETKLENAQELLGTAISSIDEFAEFKGAVDAKNEREQMTMILKEKMKAGTITKETIDNMVKVKAEHAGIIREVEVLQSATTNLGIVQKGRLANLEATAKTALELLQAVP